MFDIYKFMWTVRSCQGLNSTPGSESYFYVSDNVSFPSVYYRCI